MKNIFSIFIKEKLNHNTLYYGTIFLSYNTFTSTFVIIKKDATIDIMSDPINVINPMNRTLKKMS